MPGRRKRGRLILIVATAAIVAAGVLGAPYVRSAALLMDMTGTFPSLRRWVPVAPVPVTTRDVDVPTRAGAVPARLYEPDALAGPAIVVVPGVHGGGLDEPRLVALSRRIAGAGATVLSAPIPDLRRYEMTPSATDQIEDVARWMAGQPGLAPDGRVGLVGISFAGGLALVAAGRPALAGRLTAVFALGAHADLPRVLRYLCSAGGPATWPPPHDYGVALMLRTALPHVVPADQIGVLDRAIVTFLDASSAQTTDPALAGHLAAEARAAEASLPEPARGLMHAVNERDVAMLGRLLEPYAETIGGHPALSPERSPATLAPVFLLHGAADSVIPATETEALARTLTTRGNHEVESLVTPLLSHADAVRTAGLADSWRLIQFWTGMWRTFESK